LKNFVEIESEEEAGKEEGPHIINGRIKDPKPQKEKTKCVTY